MDDLSLTLKCPECGLPSTAQLSYGYRKYLIYTCPRCKSNVAYYKRKVAVISDKLFSDLIERKKLKHCGDVLFSNKEAKKSPGKRIVKRAVISKEQITDLKILLNTEDDIIKIISEF